MTRLTAVLAVVFLPTSVLAAAFQYVGAPQVRKLDAPVPAVRDAAPVGSLSGPGRTADRVEAIHLLVNCGNEYLLGFADTEEQYREALALWTESLTSAGIQVGSPSFEDGAFKIPYTAPGGRVLRRFLADPKQFKPKDEESMRENMAMVLGALQTERIPIVTSFPIDVEYLLPTYAVYYLVEPQEMREREDQLRILNGRGDLDFDLLEAGGVNILQKPKPWLMVYIGREVGRVARLAKTREDAEKKLAALKEYYAEQGMEVIGSKIEDLPEPEEPDGVLDEYKFVLDIYFFR